MDSETQKEKPEESTKEGVGPVVGTAIIILVLLAGAYYFYTQEEQIQKIKASYRPESTTSLAASAEANLTEQK